jgi:hypothetical protein
MNVPLFLEIRNEYTEHLVDTITPYIYEGLTSIYKDAVRLAEETNCDKKTLFIFQKLLQSINNWNQIRINEETIRIKQQSNTADYLDDLVKAVIKSNIILLAYSNTISNNIGQSFYNSLTTSMFIHRCYTECGKYAHNNPYLFFHDVEPMDYKRNQIIIHSKIQEGITRAIRKILPISLILKEYLVNSINIVQEPPKVELIGLAPQINNTLPNDMLINQPINQKPLSEAKIDPNLEKEVLRMINTENNKSEKQKIQAIMNIDKIISSREPSRVDEMSARNLSEKKELSTITRRIPDYYAGPNLFDEDNNYNEDIMNNHLRDSDRKILNINIDDENSGTNNNKKSVSITTISGRGMPTKFGYRPDPESSERIDPSKINLIEDYGSHYANNKRNMKRQLNKNM